MGTRSGVWITRTIRSGRVGEKIKYFLPDDPGRSAPGAAPTRDQRRRLERAEKKAEGSSLRQLARILNANWPAGSGGVLLGLDYDDRRLRRVRDRAADPGDLDAVREAAEHELRLALRRVKRRIGEIRYVAVTSDMDGDTGEAVRVHHHLIVDAGAVDAFREAWGAASVHADPLNDRQEDYTPVAAYLLRQVRRIPDAKKYTPSRNLKRPAPRDRIAQGPAQLRVPSGDRLVESRTDRGGRVQYLRYIIGGAPKRGDVEREGSADPPPWI